MDITQIPFNKLIGIIHSTDTDYLLQLDAKSDYLNHLNTVHAAALFTLAEGSGGQFLLNVFPENSQQVIPVVRKVEVIYKKPAQGIIRSQAKLKDDSIERIKEELDQKGKVQLTTTVELFDEQKNRVFMANFEWFVIVKL
jgi:acyl-coenzyme A thioesterase PaaI-like protein